MSRLTYLLVVMWLCSASAQSGWLPSVPSIRDITNIIKNIVMKVTTRVVHPIEKTVVSYGFSQCDRVKRLLGWDYDSYNTTEPDLSDLTLHFVSRVVNVTFKLTAAAKLVPHSPWFDPHKPLKIYLHGFTDHPSAQGFVSLSNAFLAQGDVNIVALDASSLIHWWYLRSTTMVRFIGQELGTILAAMVAAGLNPANIHLIGHSLGGHISGFAGKTFTSLTGYRVGRISGLDPAGPCFSNVNSTLRLNKHDAHFVDVIHTDAGIFGLEEKIGHVDFYPNSGSQQPHCLPISTTLLLAYCSHSRAWLLFAESVSNPHAFIGVQCADWQAFMHEKCDMKNLSVMGYATGPGTRGTYYLQTGGDPPYGLGRSGIIYSN